jgi:hypothetical protein
MWPATEATSSELRSEELAVEFSFTESQWHEIREAAWDGCTRPWNLRKVFLTKVANTYLHEASRHLCPSERRAAWKRVARLLGETRAAIAVADPLGLRELEFSFDEQLDYWQRAARGFEGRSFGEPHPRAAFFKLVLDLWIFMGGGLGFSRASAVATKPGKLGGPTIRYLSAVTRAVMGDAAPTVEGLRRILERYRANFEESLLKNPELAVSRAEVRGFFGPNFRHDHYRKHLILTQYLNRGRAEARLLARGVSRPWSRDARRVV